MPCLENDPHETPDRPDWPVIVMTLLVGGVIVISGIALVVAFVMAVQWVGGI